VAAATAIVVLLALWQWTNQQRIGIEPAVAAQLEQVPPHALYLGRTFEGLPLRSVEPFYYSNCRPGRPHTTPCYWLRVVDGKVTGSDAKQVARAKQELRPLGADG